MVFRRSGNALCLALAGLGAAPLRALGRQKLRVPGGAEAESLSRGLPEQEQNAQRGRDG
jgi:hypothetical protein